MDRVTLALLALLGSACHAPAPAPPAVSEYEARVAPLFAARCGGCHGPEKQKGGLALHTRDGLLAGGVSGPVLVPGRPEESELVRRLELPLAHEDHMPPKERPQPSADEHALLVAWIAGGARFDGARAPAEAVAAPAPAPAPAAQVPPPAADALAALERARVHVERCDPDSERLLVDCAAVAPEASDAELARLLAPLAPQVADLGLARTQAGAETLSVVRRMDALVRLDLRASRVGDGELARLAGHARLAELVLAKTKLTGASVATLRALPALQRLYVWDCGLPAEELARLRAGRPGLVVDAGDAAAAEPLEVEPAPKFVREAPAAKPASAAAGATAAAAASLAPVNVCCPVSGAPLDPRYSIVFEGRVIGFCCNKCPGVFWADPEKFRAKLP